METNSLVGGVDISYGKDGKVCICMVVMRLDDMEQVYEQIKDIEFSQSPYQSGKLALREGPAILESLQDCRNAGVHPDVLLIDGNGRLHPERNGLACWVGEHGNIRTIGVAKQLLVLEGMRDTEEYKRRDLEVGECIRIYVNEDECVGVMMRSSPGSIRPIYVSVGKGVELEECVEIIKKCCGKYRIPEPIRQADLQSRAHLRDSGNGDEIQ